MIDLAWANDSMLAHGISSEVATDFPPLADHEPVISTISWDTQCPPKDIPPFRWSTHNEERF
ncbi:uncharacterized protein EURHEDRAFT_410667 [Aspergillus ruber CBS 135680]|uniref:Endonuclease/exonuclease/phosphatase domain-containing protein n=1 Tax=Aspergillus ruber (strain CBS 135680) TaxID=1388766 RepID=A0A017SIT1_ASPRC|nr:uncharacterized protein EURHEDRAFT_410667 [Aspergillus ruber CBS 135680]EYE96867.1 hypothetical protein EURHEDRAFT_410667 [Aspergillus ruber CBS 135680]